MSKSYKLGDKGSNGLLVTAMDKYHRELVDEHVNVALLMIGNATGPAITHGGHQVVARCCIVSPRDNAFMGVDAIIEIDAGRWADLTPKQALALLDHELTHLVLQRGAHGVKRWDDGRAKLESLPDDWYLTGFVEVIERHGDDAIEAMALGSTIKGLSEQGIFDFMRTPKLKPKKQPKAPELRAVSEAIG